jgi:hypothetical protein
MPLAGGNVIKPADILLKLLFLPRRGILQNSIESAREARGEGLSFHFRTPAAANLALLQ